MLGPQSLDKRIGAAIFNSTFSIPGLFTAASREEYAKVDEKLLKRLVTNVGNYVESYREATKVKVTRAVDSWLQEAAFKGVKTDVQTVLGGELAEVWGKVTSDMKRLVDTEASNARNTGSLDGIIRVNAAHAIDDPVIYFVVVRDSHLCDECKRLHMMPDGITPKLWYLSELGHGYHKKGEHNPKLGGLHPHCRCSIVTLMPGFGFNPTGFVTFIKPDYDALAEQRKTQKSEPAAGGVPLEKDVKINLKPKVAAKGNPRVNLLPPTESKEPAVKTNLQPPWKQALLHQPTEAPPPVVTSNPDLETDRAMVNQGHKYKIPALDLPRLRLKMPYMQFNGLDGKENWVDWDQERIDKHQLEAFEDRDNKELFRTLGDRIVKAVGSEKPGSIGDIGHIGLAQISDDKDNADSLGVYYSEEHRRSFAGVYIQPNLAQSIMTDPEFYAEPHPAIKVLTHEFLHAASHQDHMYEPKEWPTRPAAALEEASTELLAQHYAPAVSKSLGHEPPGNDPNETFIWGSGDIAANNDISYSGFCEQFAKLAAVLEGLEYPTEADIRSNGVQKKTVVLNNAAAYWAHKIKKHGEGGELYQGRRDKSRQDLIREALLDKMGLKPPSDLGNHMFHPWYGLKNDLDSYLWGQFSINGGKVNPDAKPGFIQRNDSLEELQQYLHGAKKKYLSGLAECRQLEARRRLDKLMEDARKEDRERHQIKQLGMPPPEKQNPTDAREEETFNWPAWKLNDMRRK